MATLIANTISNGTTTDDIDTTGATLLVIIGGGTSLATMSASDNKSNVWTELTDHPSGDGDCRLAYVVNPTVGTGHNFSIASGSDKVIAVLAFSGVNAFDQQSGAINSTTPGSITPAVDNEVLVLGGVTNDGEFDTVDSGFTLIGEVPFDVHVGLASCYQIQTTATARNPALTGAATTTKSVAMASFMVAGSVYPKTVRLQTNKRITLQSGVGRLRMQA